VDKFFRGILIALAVTYGLAFVAAPFLAAIAGTLEVGAKWAAFGFAFEEVVLLSLWMGVGIVAALQNRRVPSPLFIGLFCAWSIVFALVLREAHVGVWNMPDTELPFWLQWVQWLPLQKLVTVQWALIDLHISQHPREIEPHHAFGVGDLLIWAILNIHRLAALALWDLAMVAFGVAAFVPFLFVVRLLGKGLRSSVYILPIAGFLVLALAALGAIGFVSFVLHLGGGVCETEARGQLAPSETNQTIQQ
jgi:hypothetical protein